jgi:hypothetical protein
MKTFLEWMGETRSPADDEIVRAKASKDPRLAGTKVLDSDGLPLMVYHGGGHGFSDIKTPAWFSANRGDAEDYAANAGTKEMPAGRLFRVFLRMTNPVRDKGNEDILFYAYDKKKVELMKRQGFDGMENHPWYVVFDEDQIVKIET